ncbi:MAG: ABC transporter permease [Marinifilaceae bacterium]
MIPIKQSLRTLARFKTYTIINLAGLVLSLSCALILMRYIHQEYTVNDCFPDADKIFVVTCKEADKEKEGLCAWGTIPKLEEQASVTKTSRLLLMPLDNVYYNEQKYKLNTIVVSELFLDMLPVPIIVGQSKLERPDDALISKRYADRIFGNEDPLGKTIKTSCEKEVIIRGIFDNQRYKTSFTHDLIISMELRGGWNKMSMKLVQLNSAEDAEKFNTDRSGQFNKYSEAQDWYPPYIDQLHSIKDFYLNNKIIVYGIIQQGNQRILHIFIFIVVLLLLIGVLNYIGLHSVISLKRGKEFGIKKVYGENRLQFVAQLFLENLLLSFFALFLAWIIVEITRGIIHSYYDITIVSDIYFDVLLTLGICVGIALFATLFPYVRYKRLCVMDAFKTSHSTDKVLNSRMVFIWFQFFITISIVLLSGLFYKQVDYMLNYDVNYNVDNIVRCRLNSYPTFFANYANLQTTWQKYENIKLSVESIAARVKESPLFIKSTFGELPTQISSRAVFKDEKNTSTAIAMKWVDEDYMDLLGYKLTEGRFWEGDDMSRHGLHIKIYTETQRNQIIITESVKRYFNITDITTAKLTPETAWSLRGGDNTPVPCSIIGVVEDIKLGSLIEPAPLVIFRLEPQSEILLAEITPGKRQEAITFLSDLYKEVTGYTDFEYTFLEDDIAAQYSDEQRQMRIYITFALIAVFIACLGLFGLSLYDIRQRYREIAIRKINGASKGAIFRLLMRKYVFIIGSAFVVSSAISYVAIEKYMENFYHRAPLSGWIFVVALLLISVVAFATLWWQVRNAIRLNPAEVIKME